MRKKKSISSIYAQINWEKAAEIFKNIKFEKEKDSSYPSTKKILTFVAAMGKIGLVFAFPKAAKALVSLPYQNEFPNRWRTKQIIKQIAKQKFVTIKENKDNTVTVKITQNGIVRALTYHLKSMKLIKPKSWDKKWRVVIFDIPEKYKKIRDIFRARLKQLGLYHLQDSVFVSPYSCLKEIEFLRQLYGVSFTVRYLLVEKIEDDYQIKKYFNLD